MDLVCDERLSDSPFVERVWHANSGSGGAFISMADSHPSVVVTTFHGKTILTVRGPETRASPAFAPPDAEFLGIVFRAGTYLSLFPANFIMDRNDVNLPPAATNSFWLNGSAWQFPSFDNADTFVQWLARDGLLVHDPLIEATLRGRTVNVSLRSVQRRFLRATGLKPNQLRQIDRARYAAALLKAGTSFLDTVFAAGYYDQPHLTRSLKHFIGLTPTQIVDQTRKQALSFLYKTSRHSLGYDTYVRNLSGEEQQNAENHRG